MGQTTPGLRVWAWINFLLALLVLAIFPIASLGSQTGLWDFRGAFSVIKIEPILGGITVISSVVLLIVLRRRQIPRYRGFAWVSLIVVIVALTPLLIKAREASQLPPIHDITTDTENPPAFFNAVNVRPEGSNSLTYGGAELAAQQRAAYPNVKPIVTALSPVQAFQRAKQVADELGWKIDRSDESAGTIEATETSFWFAFVDDIVIRIRPRPDGAGSRVDLRSISRVGMSDIGANAARIERFINAFQEPNQ
jgi:uncharacterized protein (DUF1499 family)